LKTALLWTGSALAVVAAAIVLHRLWAQSGQLPPGILRAALPSVAQATVIYITGGGLLAIAWWLAMRVSGAGTAPLTASMAGYLSSQLGKYLPGNVGHFAARHVIGRRFGASHSSLVAATLVETLVMMAAAACLALLVIPKLLSATLAIPVPIEWMAPAPILAVVALLTTLLLARHCGWLASSLTTTRMLAELSLAWLLSMAFFFLGAICFLLAAPGIGMGEWMAILPWVAAAWLLGFIVPGAPAGLGIRELVLTLGLAPLIGEAEAAMYAVLFRIVTTAGDAGMSAIGIGWLRQLSDTDD
jgi:glycosyltransferase 2 family protein